MHQWLATDQYTHAAIPEKAKKPSSIQVCRCHVYHVVFPMHILMASTVQRLELSTYDQTLTDRLSTFSLVSELGYSRYTIALTFPFVWCEKTTM